jgi:hypothetical protein
MRATQQATSGCSRRDRSHVRSVVGRESQPPCGCWADHWGVWQYNAQLLIALCGALSLVVAVFCYATRRRHLLMFNLVITIATITTWSGFALTGSI